jgi:hypothetical protein
MLVPGVHAAVLMLDYFVRNPADPASLIDLAVTFLPFNPSELPKEIATSIVVHAEMLAPDEKALFDWLLTGPSDKNKVRSCKLMGDEAVRAKSERLLAHLSRFLLIWQVNRKIDQCFADQKEHSCCFNIGNIFVWIHVHPGGLQVLGPSLQGRYIARCFIPGVSMEQFAALLMLDYFVEDPTNSASPIELAVSFLFLEKSSELPQELAGLSLMYREFLDEEERAAQGGAKPG